MELFEVCWLHALLKCYIYNIRMARGFYLGGGDVKSVPVHRHGLMKTAGMGFALLLTLAHGHRRHSKAANRQSRYSSGISDSRLEHPGRSDRRP